MCLNPDMTLSFSWCSLRWGGVQDVPLAHESAIIKA